MLGEYDNGLGRRWQDAHPMRFWAGGEVSFPWLSDGMWFLTQFRCWGLLKQAPDYPRWRRALTASMSGRLPPRR